MSFRRGDFVDCAFPFRERPDRPETNHPHIAYVERIARRPDGTSVVVLYTTTMLRPPGQPKRKGEVDIDERASQAMGMQRAFTIDVFRVLIVPLSERWFPNPRAPRHGIRGHAPETLQRHVGQIFERAVAQQEPQLDVYPRRSK